MKYCYMIRDARRGDRARLIGFVYGNDEAEALSMAGDLIPEGLAGYTRRDRPISEIEVETRFFEGKRRTDIGIVIIRRLRSIRFSMAAGI
jgi:hypothetical protein